MADSQRIDDLRRRVQKDPASIAFAQLAEECRRARQFDEAVSVCRAGLAVHPGYVSARVTLGRALVGLTRLSEAQAELETALKGAPENLAAIRALADIHDRRGDTRAALIQYRTALALAPNDPDLDRTVTELSRRVEPDQPAVAFDGTPFEPVKPDVVEDTQPAFRTPFVQAPQPAAGPADAGIRQRALQQIAALERWLDALHVVRAERRA